MISLSDSDSPQSGHMMYIFYGSLGVLLWKCGTQLLKVPRRWLNPESDLHNLSPTAHHSGPEAAKKPLYIMLKNFTTKTKGLFFDYQEAKYRSLDEEEEKKKKLQLSKMSKYKKVVYWF